MALSCFRFESSVRGYARRAGYLFPKAPMLFLRILGALLRVFFFFFIISKCQFVVLWITKAFQCLLSAIKCLLHNSKVICPLLPYVAMPAGLLLDFSADKLGF